jgi:hypothetical protein
VTSLIPACLQCGSTSDLLTICDPPHLIYGERFSDICRSCNAALEGAKEGGEAIEE